MTVKKLLDLVAAGDVLENFIKQNRLPKNHFLSLHHDNYFRGMQEKFLRNIKIVESSEELKQALKKINLVVRRIMRRAKIKKFCQMSIIDKLYTIFLFAKNLFARIFAKGNT